MPTALTPYDAGIAAAGNLQASGWSGLRELSASADPIELPLVTGAGRSGTHSVAEYLNHFSIPSVHEGAHLDHVSVGWNFAGAGALPQGSFPMEKPRDEQMRRRGVVFQPVVHLVREPLSSIHALAGCLCPGNAIANKRLAYLDNASYEYASRCLDNNTWLNAVLRRSPPSRLAMATAYWVSWNKLAASNAQARHHLETLDGNQLVADLGRSAVGRRLPAFDVHKSSVPHTGGRLSWRSLRREVGEKLADECFELAVELGYTYTYSTRHDDAQLWKIGGVAINTTVYGDKGIWTTVSTALQPPVVQSQWSQAS
jgi:hypothetical protein